MHNPCEICAGKRQQITSIRAYIKELSSPGDDSQMVRALRKQLTEWRTEWREHLLDPAWRFCALAYINRSLGG